LFIPEMRCHGNRKEMPLLAGSLTTDRNVRSMTTLRGFFYAVSCNVSVYM
jgi:hypothetical protein